MQPAALPVILPKPHIAHETHHFDIPRSKRSRAKRSCDLCRKKKTRCNADIVQPCSTCRSNGATCEFVLEQKKRGPVSSSYIEELENRVRQLETMLQHVDSAKTNSASTSPANEQIITNPTSTTPALSTPNGPPVNGFCNAMIDGTSTGLADDLGRLQLTDYDRTMYIGGSAGVHLMDQQLFSTNQRHRIQSSRPWVVQKVNSETDEHVIIHSQEYHAPDGLRILAGQPHPQHRLTLFADIPEMTTDLADAIIKSYFIHVHPHCPIVNKMSFLEQYYYQHPQPPDTHLLYAMCTLGAQCMMRGDPPAHERETLTKLYETLKSKAEQTLEYVHKRSKLSTVQTLLLLTMFANYSEDLEDGLQQWYTCGLAIRMAQGLGLHRTSTQWQIPEHEIELRRRIWYAAYNLDRQVAAEMGRPIAILDEDFDVQLPSVFELQSSFQTQTFDDARPDLIVETETAVRNQTPVYDMFLQGVALSRLLGHVLISLYSPKVVNSSIQRDGYVVDMLYAKLIEWKTSLPRHLNYVFSSAAVKMPDAGFLNISYNCVLLLMHRPFIADDKIMDMTRALQAISICTAAATGIMDTALALEKQGYPCVSWSSVSYAIFQSALVSIHNAKSDNQSVRQQGIRNLKRCAEAYAKDELVRSCRIAGLVSRLAQRYSVFNGGRQQDGNNDAISFCPNLNFHHVAADNNSPSSSGKDTSDEVETAIPIDNANEETRAHNAAAISSSMERHEQTVSPTALLNSALQFDLASLTSDLPLWNAPSGVTWTEWDSFLQPQQP